MLHRLCIVTHVAHYRHQEKLYAYGPYAREIDVWADLFPEVEIAAPCLDVVPPGDCIPFGRANIRITPQRQTGGTTPAAKLKQLWQLPRLVADLVRVLRRADAAHVRCPGNLGLLGVLLAPLFTRYRIAKYAGQWSAYPGEAATVRLQRRLLASRWWNAPVTVYGNHPGQPDHVVSFFTSILTDTQVARARRSAAREREGGPLRILYVGRLIPGKNVETLIDALAQLDDADGAWVCDVVGDGELQEALARRAKQAGLAEKIRFHGGVPFEEVLAFYERSDVLVLVSETEGWPKAIAEAMAFGLLCIGNDRGLVPEMLAGGRGFSIPVGEAGRLAETLRGILANPTAYRQMRVEAARWGQRYSLEHLAGALREVMIEHWGTAPETTVSEVHG